MNIINHIRRLGWGLIMSLVALIVSLGAALLASVQTVRLSAVFDAANSTKSIQDQPSHPCASLVKENSLTEGDCKLHNIHYILMKEF